MGMNTRWRARRYFVAVGVLVCALAFSGTSWGYWLETQLAGVRLGDSAFVLYEMVGYGNPDAIVVQTTQSAAGPATSASFDGRSLGGISASEGPGGGGGGGMGMGGPGAGAFGGPEGPFGAGGSAGRGPGGGMGMMGAPPGGGSGGPQMVRGVAGGFFGSTRSGTLNVQTMGEMGAAMGMAGQLAGRGGPSGMPPMPPGAGAPSRGGAPAGMPGAMGPMGGFGAAAGAGPTMGQAGPGAGAAGAGGAAFSGLTGGVAGSGVSSFPDWALSVWFELRENEIEYFYIRDNVAVGFVVNKLDGKIVAISVAGEKCDFARTAMWRPHEYIQLGDSFKQVMYRYGWPHDIETFEGSGDPSNAGLVTGGSVTFGSSVNSFRRDCILWYHEIRGEKQCNIAFTLHDFKVTRIHIWIPEPV